MKFVPSNAALAAFLLIIAGHTGANESLWLVPAEEVPASVVVVGHLTGGQMLVSAGPDAVRNVTAAAPFTASAKFAPTLSLAQLDVAAGPALIALVTAPHAGRDAVAAELRRRFPSLSLLHYVRGPPARWIVAMPTASVLTQLAQMPQLVWLEPHVPYQWLNIDSVGPLQANAPSAGEPPTATPIWDQNLIGSGQIIAIADSGLDRNESFFTRLDRGNGALLATTDAEQTLPPSPGALFADRKVIAYWVMPGASAYDDDQVCGLVGSNAFHGTHVAGTAAGDSGTPSTPTAANYDRGDGMAPQAQLLFQDLGNDQSGCLDGEGGPDMWAQALAGGAAIHSNSYGAPATGGYTASDAALDDFLWRNEDMLIVFAAGNAGGMPGAANVFHPGHAKHALTVAALNHGNDATPAAFSSRGPASDGRIKPDLAAPGRAIQSARGDDNDSGLEGAVLGGFSGTSMAAPAVAGGAALARQYFTDGFYPSGTAQAGDRHQPAGVLLKALLLNGTRSYPDTPAFDTGWGRMWLDSNLYFAGDERQLRVWSLPNVAGLAQGEQHRFQIQAAPGSALRATLVWYDPAPALASGAALVNDLDLLVTGPDGAFMGNVFNAGASVTGGAADAINPVEQVLLTAPAGGSYEVTVTAAAVPGNGQAASRRQGFALVVAHGQCDSAVLEAPVLDLSSDASGVSASWEAVAGAASYQLYRAAGGCPDNGPNGSARFIGQADSPGLVDTSTQGGFEYAYQVRGVDGCGEGPVSNCLAIVSQAPCTLEPLINTLPARLENFGDFCGTNVQWAAAQAQCPGATISYELHRSTDPFFEPGAASLLAGELTQPAAADYSAAPGVTHYYRAVALDSAGNRSAATAPAAYAAVSSQREPATFSDGAESLALAMLEPPWQLAADVFNAGLHSYKSGPPSLGYPPDTCAALVTPPLDLRSGAALSYQARYDLEAGFDGVVVEVSVDGGLSWSDLPPDGGYPGDFSSTGDNPINACSLAASRGAFNGSSADSFVLFSTDLSAFAEQTVQLRWRLATDPAVQLDGYYLDDVEVSQASMPLNCSPGDLLIRTGFE